MKRATIYVFLAATLWLVVVGTKRDIEARFSSFALGQADKKLQHVGNPIYDEMVAVAGKYGVDVSFMKHPIHTRKNDLLDSEIFTKPPKYYDVLIFGDSSLVWSFSPQIVSQASGLRVGFLAVESAYANDSMVRIAERLSKIYLRDGGQVVFLFAEWTWGLAPQDKQVVPSLAELADAAGSRRMQLELSLNSLLGLPRLSVYGELIEPRIDPAAYELAHQQQAGRGCIFLSWGFGKNAFLLHCSRNDGVVGAKDAKLLDPSVAVTKDCSQYPHYVNVESNIRRFVLSDIPNKILALPFSESASPQLACEAQKWARNVTILDLTKVAGEKYGVHQLEYEMATHLANTSPIIASVILGKELAARRR